jgi:hypothetical protein
MVLLQLHLNVDENRIPMEKRIFLRGKKEDSLVCMYGIIMVSLLEIQGWVSHEKSVELLYHAC